MDVLKGLREFRRQSNGILVWLRLDEWPRDLPLPRGVKLMKTGAGLFEPTWSIVLESDFTGELVGGWFILPMSLDGALEWHETEMVKRGWVKSKGYHLDNTAGMQFDKYEPRIHVEMSFVGRPTLGDSTVMIRRYFKQPWHPPKANGVGAKTRARKAKPSPRRKPRARAASTARRKA